MKCLVSMINAYEEPGNKVLLPETGLVRLDATPCNSFSLTIGDFFTEGNIFFVGHRQQSLETPLQRCLFHYSQQ